MLEKRIALTALSSPTLYRNLAQRIKRGPIFIYPTDTIYGIGAVCSNNDARDRIFRVKRRTGTEQLLLIAGKRECFNALDLIIPQRAEDLMARFWPNKITVVLTKKDLTATIGIRLSNHPFIKSLYQFLDEPLFSTSANLSSTPYNGDPETIYKTFKFEVDFMIDAGVLAQSPPSTVVAVAPDNSVTVLREGVVSCAELESIKN